MEVGLLPSFHLYNKLSNLTIHGLQHHESGLYFVLNGRPIHKVEIVGLLRKIFVHHTGDYQTCSKEVLVNPGDKVVNSNSKLDDGFSRLLSLINRPDLVVGHVVRVRGIVTTSNYHGDHFRRIKACDIALESDPNALTLWINEVLITWHILHANTNQQAGEDDSKVTKETLNTLCDKFITSAISNNHSSFQISNISSLLSTNDSITRSKVINKLVQTGNVYCHNDLLMITVLDKPLQQHILTLTRDIGRSADDLLTSVTKRSSYSTLSSAHVLKLLYHMEESSSVYSYTDSRQRTLYKSV